MHGDRVHASAKQAEDYIALDSTDEFDGLKQQALGSPARHECGKPDVGLGRQESHEAASPAGWDSLLLHTPSKSTPARLTYLLGKSRIARRLHMNGT